MGISYFDRKLIKTTPKEISEATNAAIAKVVPALSVSTTVRTPAGAAAAALTPPGLAGGLAIPEGPATPGLGAGVAPGSGGFVAAGRATVAPAPAGLPLEPAGRGGREIRMVSLRKSGGGLANPGAGGTEGGSPAPGTGGKAGLGAPGMAGAGGLGKAGPPGTMGTGGLGNPGTPGNVGFGGGVRRMVSFFRPGGGGATGPGGLVMGVRRTVSFFTTGAGGVGTGAKGGLLKGAPPGWGDLRPVGKAGGPGGLGGPGGKGTPSAI